MRCAVYVHFNCFLQILVICFPVGCCDSGLPVVIQVILVILVILTVIPVIRAVPVILSHSSHPGDLSHSSHPSHPSYPRCFWDLSCTTLQILIWGGIVVWLLLQKNIYIGWYGGYVENHASTNDLVRWDNQSKHRIHFVLPTCGASHIANKQFITTPLDLNL